MARVLKPALDRALLERFFNPRSVAIIGASTNTSRMAGRAWVNLDRTGYGGRMHLVNPNRDHIGDHRAHPDVDAIDDDLDAAIVLVPSALVPEAVEQCARRGIPAITVCTAGFSEIGEDGLQERFVAAAEAGGSRLIGPNCIGVLNVADGYVSVPTYNITYTYTPGGVTMLSHSGGMAVNLFNRAQGRGIGIRALVTLGNEADIDMAEMVEALVDDEKTRVITLFMERLQDGERFVRAVRRAREAGKPVVALKVGHSEVGRRSVESHTGALAGEPEVYSGVLRQAGVLEVHNLDELLNASHLLATLPPPAGRRAGVFTVSGGESSYFADRAAPQGLEFPMPTDRTVDRLRELIRFAVPGNPFDATGQIIGDPDYVRSVVDAFCGDDHFDVLALTTATWGTHDADQLLPSIIAAAEESPKPTVICSWSARHHTERAWELLRAAKVPVYETSDQGVDALASYVRWHLDTGHVSRPVRPREAPVPRPAASGSLDEHRSKRILADAGIPVADEVLASGSAQASEAAARFGGDVVVKLVAAGLVHKTELGLVRVGVAPDEIDEIVEEFDAVAHAEGLEVEGYLVSRRHRGMEVIVGGTVDTTFGPVVMVGAGGVLAEFERDVRFLACPVTRDEVIEALRGLRSWPVLEGVRGMRHDVDALVDLVVDLAAFVDGARDWLGAVDLNPVIVAEAGAVAVDATVVVNGGSR
ncbi:MAG TPA: acetate--CoA ligase family protein [Acidimicrobiia bacterium]|nr:acetate--CoA ligase family protein [Acidimicrobiia bacterium]